MVIIGQEVYMLMAIMPHEYNIFNILKQIYSHNIKDIFYLNGFSQVLSIIDILFKNCHTLNIDTSLN